MIEYNAVTEQQLESLKTLSTYCTQDMYYHCNNADLVLDHIYGWYKADFTKVPYWAGNTGRHS